MEGEAQGSNPSSPASSSGSHRQGCHHARGWLREHQAPPAASPGLQAMLRPGLPQTPGWPQAPMSSPRLPGRCCHRPPAEPRASAGGPPAPSLCTDPPGPVSAKVGLGSAWPSSFRASLRSCRRPPLGHPGCRALSTLPGTWCLLPGALGQGWQTSRLVARPLWGGCASVSPDGTLVRRTNPCFMALWGVICPQGAEGKPVWHWAGYELGRAGSDAIASNPWTQQELSLVPAQEGLSNAQADRSRGLPGWGTTPGLVGPTLSPLS